MAENEIKDDNFVKDHEFDGIKELDNPPPPWIMWVLYITIFWSALYVAHYHIFKQGDLQDAEYKHEMMKAEASKVMVAENSAKATEQTTENLSTDDMVKLGKDLYVQKGCTACHGVSGEGNVVGPNLTDKYWIHGNLNGDIFKSIKFGYATKGMTPYKDQLTDDKIQALVAYIEKDLVDSNPNNPKEPQGELVK